MIPSGSLLSFISTNNSAYPAVDLSRYKGGIRLEIPLEVDPSESEVEKMFFWTQGESVDTDIRR